ncbi:MAG: 30S ribosomal protein S9 [Candidatus Margulisiibacteriota bacterium]
MGEAKKKAHKEEAAPKKKAAAAKTAKPAVRKKKAAAPEAVVAPVEAVKPEAVAAPVKPTYVAKPKKAKLPGPKFYGTGRRKEAIAKVWLVPGTGKVTVNDKPLSQYFSGRRVLEHNASRPLTVAQVAGQYDIIAEAYSGGIAAQATAVGLGIARALIKLNPELKTLLKREGLMTRDPRTKERKKYGRKRARRGFQYSKR